MPRKIHRNETTRPAKRDRPTPHLPGTRAKLDVLVDRARKRADLFQPGDAGHNGTALTWAQVERHMEAIGVHVDRDDGSPRTVVPFSFGSHLKKLRQRRGWTPKTLARRSGLTTRAVLFIEADQRLPTMPTLIALADALEVSLDALVGRDAPAA